MSLNGHTPVPFVDLSAQYQSIKPQVDSAIASVLQRTNFILGDDVAAFEDAFAAYCGVAHGVGVDSGTSALELALRAYDIGEGDEVITAANTFIATALAISYCGATPVFVDVDPETYMMDVSRLEESVTPRTRAIMPVHLYGHPVDMAAVNAVAERHGLVVIEDASQAHGATYCGQTVGSLGHMAVFSLYPAKNLGAYGDAGVIVTDDAAAAERLRLLRNYGSPVKYHHEVQGFNRRLDTLQAAVLRVKLDHLPAWTSCRREHAAFYDEALADTAVGLPQTEPSADPVYHLYVIRHPARDALQAYLKEQGIATVIHYPIPIHLQPAYAELGLGRGAFPVTERLSEEILSLPMYPELPPAGRQYTVDMIKRFVVEYEAVGSRATVYDQVPL